jgi:hypothetical protein
LNSANFANLANLSNSPSLINVENPPEQKVEDLEKYKSIIEQQKRIISILTNKLKNSDSQEGLISADELLNTDIS